MNDPPDRISDTFHEPLVTSVTGSRYESSEAIHQDHRHVGVLGTFDMSFVPHTADPVSALVGSQTLQATIPHRTTVRQAAVTRFQLSLEFRALGGFFLQGERIGRRMICWRRRSQGEYRRTIRGKDQWQTERSSSPTEVHQSAS